MMSGGSGSGRCLNPWGCGWKSCGAGRRAEKGLTSTLIRQKIIRDEPWEDLVPAGVAPLFRQLGLLARIRGLAADS